MMVYAVLEETLRTKARVRVLPARLVVYLVLGGGLFQGLGYCRV